MELYVREWVSDSKGEAEEKIAPTVEDMMMWNITSGIETKKVKARKPSREQNKTS